MSRGRHVFAVMQYTVARRTREIGIRVALGATRGRVILGVFRRPLAQVALGVLTGGVLLAGLFFGAGPVTLNLRDVLFLTGYVLFTGAVCMLACIGPVRRALAVEPARALSADG